MRGCRKGALVSARLPEKAVAPGQPLPSQQTLVKSVKPRIGILGPSQTGLFVSNADGTAERPLLNSESLDYNPLRRNCRCSSPASALSRPDE